MFIAVAAVLFAMSAATVVAVIGGLAILVGLMGVVSPSAMRAFASLFRSPTAIYAGISVRLIVGIILLVDGPDCRPDRAWVGYLVRAIGVLAIVVAISMMLQGPKRLLAMMDWWLKGSDAFQRGTSLVALAVGSFLIFAGV